MARGLRTDPAPRSVDSEETDGSDEPSLTDKAVSVADRLATIIQPLVLLLTVIVNFLTVRRMAGGA